MFSRITSSRFSGVKGNTGKGLGIQGKTPQRVKPTGSPLQQSRVQNVSSLSPPPKPTMFPLILEGTSRWEGEFQCIEIASDLGFFSFLMWTILKVFIECVTILPLLGSGGVLAPNQGWNPNPNPLIRR